VMICAIPHHGTDKAPALYRFAHSRSFTRPKYDPALHSNISDRFVGPWFERLMNKPGVCVGTWPN